MQLSESRALTTYVERLSQEIFSKPLPKAPEITSAEWAQRAEEVTAPKAG